LNPKAIGRIEVIEQDKNVLDFSEFFVKIKEIAFDSCVRFTELMQK